MNSIEITDLSIFYGSKKALENLSLTVRTGEIFGFLGPNGAGKSSTIKAILGLIDYQKGSIQLNGLPAQDPASRAFVGFLPEEANYYRFLTPAETLRFYGEIFEIPSVLLKDRIEKYLNLTGLWPVRHKPISTFSKGMTQKVSLAQALINEPKTLILDEPTTGLDPLAKMDLRKILIELKKEGRTIFFSSHELSEVEMLCDSVAILKGGRILKQGSLASILDGSKEKSLELYFLKTIQEEK